MDPGDPGTRKKLIDQYKDGYRVVAEVLAGATDEELDTPPAPGRWTAREIAHHLRDADWRREGTHSEVGPYPPEQWLEIYAVHAHGHADQILVARDAGKKKKLST